MRIEVHGIPAPQGSKRHVGGGRMVESSRAVGPWREAVRAETQRVIESARIRFPSGGFDTEPEVKTVLLARARAVEVVFYLPRPKSTPKRQEFPFKRPDIDKLARAVLDGLTDGGALDDDGQVVQLIAAKRFADKRRPGCLIFVNKMRTP